MAKVTNYLISQAFRVFFFNVFNANFMQMKQKTDCVRTK